MARVKFGPSLVGIRGTVGGMTFSANGSSSYVKVWRRPSSKRTALQQAPRAIVSGAGANWRALTSGQRSDWDTWAGLPAQVLYDAFGDPYSISGWSWYVTLSQWAATAGQAAPGSAPTATRPVLPTISSVDVDTASSGTVTVTFAAGEFEDLWCIVGLSVTTESVAIAPAAAQMRIFASGQLTAGDTTAVITDLADKLGIIQAGQVFTWKVWAQNSESNRGASAQGNGTVV